MLSVLIFADERRYALRALNRDETLSRVASIVRVLAETPPELHGRVLDAATSRRLRFWESAQSAVGVGVRGFATNRAAEHLRRLLGPPAERRIFIDIREIEFGWFRTDFESRDGDRRHRDDDDDDDHDHEDDDDGVDFHERWHHGHGPTSLLISVELDDGRWLNAENLLLSDAPGRRMFAWVILAMMIGGVSLASILLVRRITKPMKRLAEAAEQTGRGEAAAPLEETGPLEARNTIRAFNDMRERLKRFIDDRTHMLAATSHDLRTPLTSLRLRAELVEDEDLKTKMLTTLDEMRRMVDAMMAFAREDTESEETRDVDLTALVGSIVDDLESLGQRALLADSGRIVLRCRPFALTRALRNLIENAARHGGGAAVRIEESAGEIGIVIEDDGPGIPKDHLERVFDPFVRLDEARGQETGGMGLGLAIARSIVRGHGGDIAIANREAGGLRVRVWLPKA